MAGCGLGSVLQLQRFSASASVWEMLFSPHSTHASMLKLQSYECESTYRLFFSPQESCNSNLTTDKEI
jgi:hypothetical protein